MELPFPLVQLVRRVENAKSALDRHHNAYYLGELAIKLAAAARAAVYLAQGGGCERTNRALSHMIWPSTGDWVELFEHAGAFLPAPGHEPLREVGEIEAFCHAARADINASHLDFRRLRLVDFFGLLAQYRNKAIAHAPQKLPLYYDEIGPRLERAVRSVIGQASASLCLGMRIAQSGGRLCWTSGLADYPLEPLIMPGAEPDSVGVLTRVTTVVRRHGTILRSIEYHDYNTGLRVTGPRPDARIVEMLARTGDGVDFATLRERRNRKPLEEMPDPASREHRWIGPYEKLGDLGSDRVSRVWLCRERGFRRLVALESPRDAERAGFFPEIDHPNVARTLALCRHRGRSFTVTEYVDGLDLDHLIRVLRRWYAGAPADASNPIALAALAHPMTGEIGRQGAPHPLRTSPQHLREVARLMAGAARGLDALHEAGIVHGNTGAENIVITRDGQRAVLTNLCAARRGTDFGADIAGLVRCVREFATLSPLTGERVGECEDLIGRVRGPARSIAESLEAYASGKPTLFPPSCER